MLPIAHVLAALLPSHPALSASGIVGARAGLPQMRLTPEGPERPVPSRHTARAPMLQPHLDRRSALAGALCLAPTIMLPNSAVAATDPFKFFPGARMSSEVDDAVAAALDARGYQKGNTLFAHSVCSDEVNFAEKELIDLMRKRWGESFTLGGLAGVPFAGKAGLSAYAHHVPDEGKLFILFAPHVGVGYDGKVGALERAGVVSGSSACGAAVGAYKTLSKPGAAAPADFGDMNDLQFDYIKMKLSPRLSGVKAAPNDMAFVTYQMYSMVKDAMLSQIAASPGIWDDCSELAVLGGVQINRYKNKDAFQPLMFQTITKAGKRTDLYPSTFGKMPELSPLLGDNAQVASVLGQGLTLA